MKTQKFYLNGLIALSFLACSMMAWAAPVGTAFTYQGRLLDDNIAADGDYDIQFTLYDDPNALVGNQIGAVFDVNDVEVLDGYFIAELDFGNEPNTLDGDARWLQVAVRPGASMDPNDYIALNPLQELTPVPYALHAKTVSAPLELIASAPGYTAVLGVKNTGSGGVAIGAEGNQGDIGALGVSDAGVVGIAVSAYGLAGSFTGDVKVIGDIRVSDNVGIGIETPSEKLDVAGSININADETYKIDGSTVLSNKGNNIFVGSSAGTNTTGSGNSAIGSFSLVFNTTGSYNSAMGSHSLLLNTTGRHNSAVGYQTLYSNTEGSYNSAMGSNALYSNTTGNSNTGVGEYALRNNMTGSFNSAIGNWALNRNTTGNYNSAMGRSALSFNTIGSNNIAVGHQALTWNSTGNNNVAIGMNANIFNEEGSNNTIVGSGAGAGSSLHNKSGNVFIGYHAGSDEMGDNRLYIENSDSSSPLIYGEFDNNLVAINGQLKITGGSPGNGKVLKCDDNGLANWQTDNDGIIVESDPTVLSSVKDGVSWAELAGIPSGFADNVDDVGGGDTDWTISSNDMYSAVTGNVGIGDSTPKGKLQVVGDEVRIGNAGTVNYATSDGDLYVEDTLEVDGNAEVAGTVSAETVSADNMPGCEFSSSASLDNVPTAMTNVTSVELTLNAGGYVIVTFSGSVIINTASETVYVGIGTEPLSNRAAVHCKSQNSGDIFPFSVQYVGGVLETGHYTYYGNAATTLGTSDIYQAKMTAIYVPNLY